MNTNGRKSINRAVRHSPPELCNETAIFVLTRRPCSLQLSYSCSSLCFVPSPPSLLVSSLMFLSWCSRFSFTCLHVVSYCLRAPCLLHFPLRGHLSAIVVVIVNLAHGQKKKSTRLNICSRFQTEDHKTFNFGPHQRKCFWW